MSKQAGFLNGYGIAPVPGSNVNHSLVVPTDPKLPAEQGERCDYDNAESMQALSNPPTTFLCLIETYRRRIL